MSLAAHRHRKIGFGPTHGWTPFTYNTCKTVPDKNSIASTDMSIASDSKLHALSLEYLTSVAAHRHRQIDFRPTYVWPPFMSNICKTVPDLNSIANTDVNIAFHSKLHALSLEYLTSVAAHRHREIDFRPTHVWTPFM